MTNYTKTMGEVLESMYVSEDNVGILRDIVKRKSAMPLKFADGKMKVDLFTASAVTQALDKVNPANKAKITKLINTGKKANFMSVAKVVMKSENDPEIEEEVEIKEGKFKKGDTVRVLSGPHKNDVHKIIHDHGDGTYNVKPWRTRYGGHISKLHYRLGAATAKASDLKKEEADLDEAMLIGRDYEYDEKEGVVKISKKNFRKVKKDSKGTIDQKNKPTMMVLTKKGTSLVPVKFTEEVELDEIVPVHEILPALFFGGLGAAMLGFMLVSMKMIIQGTSLEASIKKIVDKLKKNKNYKMSDSEKSDVKGFVSKVKKDKPNILQKAMKKFKEEVEESYEVGTDEYAKHTREVTPGQEKEIDEARPSARRDAMRDMGKRGKDSADDDDYKATADDRKAADKNIIMQLRKATNLGGKYEVEFKDKKKVKVKPAIAMAFIKKFEKMKPADKAKLQDKGSKSYRDLLKGLKEEDTSKLGRIERKLKEIRNG
jgi:hypothetical protein